MITAAQIWGIGVFLAVVIGQLMLSGGTAEKDEPVVALLNFGPPLVLAALFGQGAVLVNEANKLKGVTKVPKGFGDLLLTDDGVLFGVFVAVLAVFWWEIRIGRKRREAFPVKFLPRLAYVGFGFGVTIFIGAGVAYVVYTRTT